MFANSVSGPFLFDDIASIPQNPTIRSLWPVSRPLSPPSRSESVAGRPLVNLSFAANYAIGGLAVRGYHITNIAIHLGCALLIFGIVRRTRGVPDLAAWAAALLWMVHPLHSEPVDYIVARTESLMTLCLLLALYYSVRDWRIPAIAACAAGMACKETMVVAPLLIVLYDVTFARGRMKDRRAFYMALAGTWSVLVVLAAASPRGNSAGFDAGAGSAESGVWNYLLNQAVLVTHYLRLLIWPRGLVLDYGFPRALTLTEVWPSALLVVALLGVTALAIRRWPAAGFAGAWFFLVLAPTSSVIPIVTEVGAERRMYAAAIPLIALAAAALWAAISRAFDGESRRRATFAILVSAVAIALAAGTVSRNREYRSPLTMWETVVERWPNGRAYSNLATELQMAGRTSEVIPALRLAVGDFPEAGYDLGAQLITAGARPDGIAQLETFLRRVPGHPRSAAARTLLMRAWTDEGIARASAGQRAAAVQAFEAALAFDSESADLHKNLANALLEAGDSARAAQQAREALRLRPGDPDAQAVLELSGTNR